MSQDPTNLADLTPDDEGLILRPDERDALNWVRSPLAATLPHGRAIADGLATLGRLRARQLEHLADDDRPPMHELRDRLRYAIERLTLDVVTATGEPAGRLDLELTHKLKDLVCSYVQLGGDLEHTATVDGAEYASIHRELDATKGELAEAIQRRHHLEIVVDRVLAIASDRGAYFERGGALEVLGRELGRLEEARSA